MQTIDTETERRLSWHGDNSWYIASILPSLRLSDADKRVLRWAYGLDGGKSYELESDGETVVCDLYLDGIIKAPPGVCHDYVNRVPGHETPDGHRWTPWQANALYRRVCKAFGYSFGVRWRRWLGLSISYCKWWKRPEATQTPL